MKRCWSLFVLILVIGHCSKPVPTSRGTRFGDDLSFLKKHTDTFVLSDSGGQQQVAVCPQYQGRVMTSTARGETGPGFGWINREAIASGERQPHINVFGGEDRFWLGPEGGQFSVYFKKGDPFDLDHWQVPSAIDWDPFETTVRETAKASFRKAIQLENYSGTAFDLRVDREVRLLSQDAVQDRMGFAIPRGASWVAYESINTITNTGSRSWTKASGLLSIWILGMFNPSPSTTVVIPFKAGPESGLGPVVNDAYFGKVPSDRLVARNGILYFKADGQYRSKIGIGRKRALPVCGSYDAENRVLTLVRVTIPEPPADYVNSMWQIQEDPFGGDVVNTYNDGPPEPGAKPLGPFYELESSSPAAALRPGGSLNHVHRTIHLQGPERELDPIARILLGAGLEDIQSAFASR